MATTVKTTLRALGVQQGSFLKSPVNRKGGKPRASSATLSSSSQAGGWQTVAGKKGNNEDVESRDEGNRHGKTETTYSHKCLHSYIQIQHHYRRKHFSLTLTPIDDDFVESVERLRSVVVPNDARRQSHPQRHLHPASHDSSNLRKTPPQKPGRVMTVAISSILGPLTRDWTI